VKSLFIHVGYPKTGTTAIQSFLKSNREKLSQLGVFVPETPHGKASRLGQHNLREQVPDQLRKFHTAIISNEAFVQRPFPHLFKASNGEIDVESYWAARRAALEHLRAKFGAIQDIRIIVYLRHRLALFSSLYAEAIKNNGAGLQFFKGSEQEFASSIFPVLQFEKQLALLQEVFGSDRVIIRIYDPELMADPDVRRDFMEACGIDSTGFLFDEMHANRTMDKAVIEFAKELNAEPKFWGTRIFVSKLLPAVSRELEAIYGYESWRCDLDGVSEILDRNENRSTLDAGLPANSLYRLLEQSVSNAPPRIPQQEIRKRLNAKLRKPASVAKWLAYLLYAESPFFSQEDWFLKKDPFGAPGAKEPLY
jgi:hypothetical protein